MSAEGKPTVQEIVASANEGLDDAVLAALDTFGPVGCEWRDAGNVDRCPQLASYRVLFLCCGKVYRDCGEHAERLMQLVLRTPGQGSCAVCGGQVRSDLLMFTPIGGAK